MGKEYYYDEGTFTQPEIGRLLDESRRPAIFLRRQWPVGEPLEVSSYLGGLPTLPDGMAWPVNPLGGGPLHFMAQIECSEMPGMTEGPNLPEAGRLLFFADMHIDQNWPAAEALAHTRVIYAPASRSADPARNAPEDLPDIQHTLGQSGGTFARTGQRLYPKWPVDPAVVDTYLQSDNPFEKVSNVDYYNQSIEITRSQLQRLLPEIPRQVPAITQLFPSAMDVDPSTGERRAVSYLRVDFDGKLFPICALVAKDVMKSCLRSSLKRRAEAKSYSALIKDKEQLAELTEADLLGREKWKAEHDSLREFEAKLGAVFKAFCDEDDFRPLAPDAAGHLIDWINEMLQTGGKPASFVKSAVHEALCSAAKRAVTDTALRTKLPECLYEMFLDRIAPSIGRSEHMIFGAKSVGHNPSSGEGIRLLQLDSDYGLGFMFGDCGIMDFWVSEQDLQAARFDRAYGVTAST